MFELLVFIRSNYPDAYPFIDQKEFQIQNKVIEEAFDECAEGENRIIVKSLRTTSPFVRAAFESNYMWGGNYIKNLFVLRKQIQNRHAEAKSSLNAILKAK